MILRAIAMGALLSLSSASAYAIVLPWEASLDTEQATTSGPGATGTGFASGTYDTVENLLTWNVTVSGLSTPAFAAHFHGPAAPGETAGVRVELPSLDLGTLAGNTSGSFSGSRDLDDLLLANPGLPGVDVLESELLGDLWYLNIHTEAFPSGEIRGQVDVVPEPSALALIGVALVGLLAVRRRRS